MSAASATTPVLEDVARLVGERLEHRLCGCSSTLRGACSDDDRVASLREALERRARAG